MRINKIDAMNQKKRCIQDCLDCHRACQEMASCLQAEGMQADAKHVQWLLDCATICQASADFMAGDSDLQERFCGACGELCLRCAQECERFESDVRMKACIDACHRCSESCRQMAVKSAVTLASRPEWIDGLAGQPHSISPV
jgi:hypothetical protein